MITYEELTRMVESHNNMGVAQIEIVNSNSNKKLVDIYRNGKKLLLSLTYDKANCVVAALANSQKLDIDYQIERLEQLLAASIKFNCQENAKMLEEDIDLLKSKINGFPVAA